jgi:hypothetical protein
VLIKCVWYRKHRMAVPLILNPFHTQFWRQSCKTVLIWGIQIFMKLCVLISYGSENGHKMCWVGNVLFFYDLYDHISSHLTSWQGNLFLKYYFYYFFFDVHYWQFPFSQHTHEKGIDQRFLRIAHYITNTN